MALAYLKRIDKLLYLCDMYSMNGNIEKWLNTLTILYRELSIKLTDEEKKKIEGDKIKDIDEVFLNTTKEDANIKTINFICNNPIFIITKRRTILFLLHELEIKMRKKMQEKNMLLPSKEDPRKAITRR